MFFWYLGIDKGCGMIRIGLLVYDLMILVVNLEGVKIVFI